MRSSSFQTAMQQLIWCLPIDPSSEPSSSPAPDSDDREYELGEMKAKALPGFEIARVPLSTVRSPL